MSDSHQRIAGIATTQRQQAEDFSDIKAALTMALEIASRIDGRMEVQGRKLKIEDRAINAAISEQIADDMSNNTLSRLRLMPLAKRARAVTGLTQAAFAERFGIPVTCQRDWEQGCSEPPEASASYLTAILNDHEAVAIAFNKGVPVRHADRPQGYCGTLNTP